MRIGSSDPSKIRAKMIWDDLVRYEDSRIFSMEKANSCNNVEFC